MKRAWHVPQGYTLMEMVLVLVLVAVMSVYVLSVNGSSNSLTARSQADKLASDLRHAQSLAMTWGRGMQVVATATGYRVRCTDAAAAAPCNNTGDYTITDPLTGTRFEAALANGVAFTSRPASDLALNTTGTPVTTAGVALTASASYVLAGGGTQFTVAVAPTTGTVTVTSP